jgi:hypothetical protein
MLLTVIVKKCDNPGKGTLKRIQPLSTVGWFHGIDWDGFTQSDARERRI